LSVLAFTKFDLNHVVFCAVSVSVAFQPDNTYLNVIFDGFVLENDTNHVVAEILLNSNPDNSGLVVSRVNHELKYSKYPVLPAKSLNEILYPNCHVLFHDDNCII
jgi:hypothetical protein